MPWADFLMMMAANPPKKPVGTLSSNMNCWLVRWAARHSFKRSIQLLNFCFNTVLSFSAAKIEKLFLSSHHYCFIP